MLCVADKHIKNIFGIKLELIYLSIILNTKKYNLSMSFKFLIDYQILEIFERELNECLAIALLIDKFLLLFFFNCAYFEPRVLDN